MSFKLANAVGSEGKVYAVDVETSKLEKLKGHIKERGVSNIIPTKGDYDDPKLPTKSLNAAIILDTYHEMDEHEAVLKHIFDALLGGGRLLICEPIAQERRNSTRAEQEARHEVAMNYVVRDLEKAGFSILVRRDPFIDRTKIKGDSMWLLVAQKP